MTSFKSKCQEYFGTTDFYEVLKIERGATEKEIKKAYHKLSLLVHPDRVDENHKETATEKFKVLGRVHSILQDKEKRKIYDDTGDFDEESDSSFNWMDYWRKLFKKIELKDIQNYEKEYIGSELELRDIKRAYEGTRGNMDKMLEMIPFSNCDDEERIISIVRKMVDDGEVEEYNNFFNEDKKKKERRYKKWAKEKEEAESVDVTELERHLEDNMKKRAGQFGDFIADLEQKYAPKNKKQKSITNGSTRKSTRNKK